MNKKITKIVILADKVIYNLHDLFFRDLSAKFYGDILKSKRISPS